MKPLNCLQLRSKEKLTSNLSMTQISLNSLQTSLNLTEEKLRQRKKLENTLKFNNVKENASKFTADVPLATLRNQVVSASKYGHNFTLNSSERLIPLNSFVTRRF